MQVGNNKLSGSYYLTTFLHMQHSISLLGNGDDGNNSSDDFDDNETGYANRLCIFCI